MRSRFSRNNKIKRNLNKRNIIIIITSIIFLITVLFLLKYITTVRTREGNNLRNKIYTFLSDKNNRVKAYERAVKLNGGDSANTCVYFLAEVLRNNNIDIDDSVCNTQGLIKVLEKKGWKKETDINKLKPGDICFTTDEKLSKKGTPTHAYVFMKWEKEGSTDYGYICDNQAKDYDWKVYHLRNIGIKDGSGKSQKEPFSFFMYK
ncbi:hypothetical protein [Clostridium sp.]|uniref:hypothetical protein n=1 Tax=Clostridium sp. TaxID=1506 RepID=UPI0034641C88